MGTIDRRRFLQSTAALTAAAAIHPRLALASLTARKAVHVAMLPGELPLLDRFGMAVDAGFTGIEMRTVKDPTRAERIRETAERSGLRIHSVVNVVHEGQSLSSADPDVVRRSVAGVETSLRNAKLWGADAVQLGLLPVAPQTSYRDTWTRSQEVIRERILPLARELNVVVAVEEIWNRFLLGPHEVARYVDAIASPWARASLDVASVVFYAYPQDWIRTLGPRIVKVRLKDFRIDGASGAFHSRNLGDGDVDWAAVRSALGEIRYDGWLTVDLAAGDAAYLSDVAARLDRLLGA